MKLPVIFRIRFSKEWYGSVPWTNGKNPMPYIGTHEVQDDVGVVKWIFIGPIAIIRGYIK